MPESQMLGQLDHWPIDKLIPYARNPRKNDSAVDQMIGSIREFGFKSRVSCAATARWWMATYGSRLPGS